MADMVNLYFDRLLLHYEYVNLKLIKLTQEITHKYNPKEKETKYEFV